MDIASVVTIEQFISMSAMRCWLPIAMLLFSSVHASAEGPETTARIGDTYSLSLVRDSEQKSGDRSSGSTHDQDTLIERIIAVRPDGIEMEFDLPVGVSADERSQSWQFPARVFEPYRGQPQLLNRSELQARVDRWLKLAKLPSKACGQWFFTWNAFRIECDPQSVIKIVQNFDLRVLDLREGALYQDKDARAPVPLTKKSSEPDGTTFAATLEIDPEIVRRQRAESDVATGQILRKPITLDAALRERAKETISGSISVVLEADATGSVWRRSKVVMLESRKPDGQVETMTTRETLERQRMPTPS